MNNQTPAGELLIQCLGMGDSPPKADNLKQLSPSDWDLMAMQLIGERHHFPVSLLEVTVKMGKKGLALGRFKLFVSIVGIFFLLTACSGGDDGGGEGGSSQSIRVKVIDDEYGPLSDVSVVLGNAAGALIKTGKTDENGVVVFSNPPAKATVTVAHGYTSGDGGTNYDLSSISEVNAGSITLCMYNTPDTTDSEAVGEVEVTMTNPPATLDHWEIEPMGDEELIDIHQTRTIPVNEWSLQKNGKLTLVVYGYDEDDDLISYGVAQDIPFPSQTPISRTIDISQTDFAQISLTAKNIPSGAATVDFGIELARQGAWYVGPYSSFDEPKSSSLEGTFKVIPGIGDQYSCTIQVYFGDDYGTSQSINITTKAPEDSTTIDFHDALPLPAGISVTDAASATPTLQWTGGTAAADSISIGIYGYKDQNDGSSYYLSIEMPANRTSIKIPELPDTLAAFRPSNWNFSGEYNGIAYGELSFVDGWDNYLTTMHNLFSDASLMPETYTIKESSSPFSMSDTDGNLPKKRKSNAKPARARWFHRNAANPIGGVF